MFWAIICQKLPRKILSLAAAPRWCHSLWRPQLLVAPGAPPPQALQLFAAAESEPNFWPILGHLRQTWDSKRTCKAMTQLSGGHTRKSRWQAQRPSSPVSGPPSTLSLLQHRLQLSLLANHAGAKVLTWSLHIATDKALLQQASPKPSLESMKTKNGLGSGERLTATRNQVQRPLGAMTTGCIPFWMLRLSTVFSSVTSEDFQRELRRVIFRAPAKDDDDEDEDEDGHHHNHDYEYSSSSSSSYYHHHHHCRPHHHHHHHHHPTTATTTGARPRTKLQPTSSQAVAAASKNDAKSGNQSNTPQG